MAPTVVLVPSARRQCSSTVRVDGRYRAPVAPPALVFLDDDGEEVLLDAEEAATLFALTGDLDAATVSACPQCRSRIVAVVALVDLLDEAPPFARSDELVELADDAPTLHVVRARRRGAVRAPCVARPRLRGVVGRDGRARGPAGRALTGPVVPRQRGMRVRLNSLSRVNSSSSSIRSRSSTRPRSMKRTNTASSPSM